MKTTHRRINNRGECACQKTPPPPSHHAVPPVLSKLLPDTFLPIDTRAQNQAKAEQTAHNISAELARSRASEAEARRDLAKAAAAAEAAEAAEAAAKAALDAARAREKGSVARLRELEGTAAREREELDGAREACEELRERLGAAEEEARREAERSGAALEEVVARKDETVGLCGTGGGPSWVFINGYSAMSTHDEAHASLELGT